MINNESRRQSNAEKKSLKTFIYLSHINITYFGKIRLNREQARLTQGIVSGKDLAHYK